VGGPVQCHLHLMAAGTKRSRQSVPVGLNRICLILFLSTALCPRKEGGDGAGAPLFGPMAEPKVGRSLITRSPAWPCPAKRTTAEHKRHQTLSPGLLFCVFPQEVAERVEIIFQAPETAALETVSTSHSLVQRIIGRS
jgi:hypothetical protein